VSTQVCAALVLSTAALSVSTVARNASTAAVNGKHDRCGSQKNSHSSHDVSLSSEHSQQAHCSTQRICAERTLS
jgi:hypothetical protein